MPVNRTGNARDGQKYKTVTRNGKRVNVYANGETVTLKRSRPQAVRVKAAEVRQQFVNKTVNSSRKGLTGTRITRADGSVFNRYEDDLGTGLGPEVVRVRKARQAKKRLRTGTSH
jgi:hypothetical protein